MGTALTLAVVVVCVAVVGALREREADKP